MSKTKKVFVALLTAHMAMVGGLAVAAGKPAAQEDSFLKNTARISAMKRNTLLRMSAEVSARRLNQDFGTGNMIFIHPDGTGLNHWNAARIYWKGPDGVTSWDRLPEMAVYRGHMVDQLNSTSNGGATTHAFGYKVEGPGSFGKDGDGEEARDILSLSGYPGSIMREAANAGYPVGVVNDGDAAEPGTGVFLAEASNRNEANEIVTQIIDGRPGFVDEDPVVVLGGGERFFLPEGTPLCTDKPDVDCAVHTDPVDERGPARTDGRNLIKAAIADGWIVLRTRSEFEALRAELEFRPNYAPKVLGLFAADDIFNDVPEEELIRLGLVDPSIPEDSKYGNLIVWGTKPGTLGYNPPTPPEMMDMALTILDRRSEQVNKPFLLVAEVESTDNMANNDNAIGELRALKYADELIGEARRFQLHTPKTLILTAADGDAGGMQVIGPPPGAVEAVGATDGNPTGIEEENVPFPVDGLYGRGTQAFIAEPDQFGQQLPFAIAWIGTADTAGAILSRAQGINASLLDTSFTKRFDNIDVYRMMYFTLFGKALAYPQGQPAPTRPTGQVNP